MRKMATIRKIDQINPIEGADMVEAAAFGGWVAVVRKGEFAVGDLVVYVEIDAFVPETTAPYLSCNKVVDGIKGSILKTKKIRGVVSQGLVLPKDSVPAGLPEGMDVADHFGIFKYEPTERMNNGAFRFRSARVSTFPHFIPKTDQERIQNYLGKSKFEEQFKQSFEVTEKFDGSSMTVYVRDGVSGVCSRNHQVDEDTTFYQVAAKYDVVNRIKSLSRNLAVQGELIGQGIQGNPYKLPSYKYVIFNVFDIDNQQYVPTSEARRLVQQMQLEYVRVINSNFVIPEGWEIEDYQRFVDSLGVYEGVVFKADNFSFKVISNKYLLKRG